MEVLDGDDVRLTDNRGRIAERDIVQVLLFLFLFLLAVDINRVFG